MQALGFRQPLPYKLKFSLWCSDPSFRFFLEGMQDVNCFRKLNRIHSPPSVAAMRCDNFQQRPSAKPSQRLRRGITLPLLGGIQRLADIAPDLPGKSPQLSSARSHPDYRPFRFHIIHEYVCPYIWSTRDRQAPGSSKWGLPSGKTLAAGGHGGRLAPDLLERCDG
jgi:hypothetical protein